MKTKATYLPGLSKNIWKEMPTRKLKAAIYMDQELKSKCEVEIDGGRSYAFICRHATSHYIPSLTIQLRENKLNYPLNIRVFWGKWYNYEHCKTRYQGFVIGPTLCNYGKSRKACTYERAIKTIKEIIKRAEAIEVVLHQKEKERVEEWKQIDKVIEKVSKKLKTPISITHFNDWIHNIKTGLTFSFCPTENIHDEKVRRNMTLKPTNIVFRDCRIKGNVNFKNMQRLIECLKTFE